MSDNITPLNRPISYTLDGQEFSTTERKRLAADVLGEGGLDPNRYDLGELVGGRPEPKHYADADQVVMRHGARFVSIRHAADVA